MAGATSAVGAAGVSGLSALSAMNPYAAALSAAVPLAQGIYGIAQKAKANKLRKQFDQPMYAIPGAIDEATGMAQSLAYDPSLPGQSLIEAGLDRTLATGNRGIMEAGMSGAERLAAMNAGVGNRMDANTQLAIQMAQQQQQDMQNYQTALNTVAGYQDKQWQLNKQQPWLNAMEAANRLDEAGFQNMMTALKDVAGVGTAAMGKKPGTTTTGGGTAGTAGVAPAGGFVGPPTYESWLPPEGNMVMQNAQNTTDGITPFSVSSLSYNQALPGTQAQQAVIPATSGQKLTGRAIYDKNNPKAGFDFLSQLGGQMMGMK